MKMTKIMQRAALSESMLLEDEMDRAQLILAGKAVLDELQDMAEKLAKTEAEGIMPLLDGIRTAFGPEFADRLSADSAASLRAALEAVKQCKETIGANISNMEQIVTGEGPGNDMSTNLGVPSAPEATVEPELQTAEPKDQESDPAPADDEDLENVFGADAEAPLGRETKESAVASNINMLRESVDPDRLLMTQVMTRMKGGMTGQQAVVETAKSFGVDVDDVLDIVKSYTKK